MSAQRGGPDWIALAQRGLTFVRVLRGDAVDGEAAELRTKVDQLRGRYEDWARSLVGCRRDAACRCPICTEAR